MQIYLKSANVLSYKHLKILQFSTGQYIYESHHFQPSKFLIHLPLLIPNKNEHISKIDDEGKTYPRLSANNQPRTSVYNRSFGRELSNFDSKNESILDGSKNNVINQNRPSLMYNRLKLFKIIKKTFLLVLDLLWQMKLV